MTTLSLVLPTFNRRATLERSLSECLKLSKSLSVEFIIIDDGSTDSTAQYLSEVSATDSRITTQTIKNGGPGNARNTGAALATGDIVMFIGDDTFPTSTEFFEAHLRSHEQNPDPSLAVLGKMIWPRSTDYPISFVMSMIQGEGGQQFGYAHMRPFARYDWRFFYTCNVSIKRSIVDDWFSEGFSPDFRCAAFEDGEFAYRMSKKLGQFDVLYVPTSVAEHDHPYNVEGFINRQFSAGMMANVLATKHPETSAMIGVADLSNAMRSSATSADEISQPDQLAVIEGIFSSARLAERQGQLGSSAWHTPFINAVFDLAYSKGIIWSHDSPGANRSAAYRYALDQFDQKMARVLETEHLTSVIPMSHLNATKQPEQSGQTRVGHVRQKVRSRLAQNPHARNLYHWLNK